jgi:thiol-disulfide isomerase/thioredoxin
MTKWKKWARELAIFALMLAVISWGVDQWRKPAPLTTMTMQSELMLTNGQYVSLAELSADQPLLVYLWATWCAVCKFTSPTVEALNAGGVNVLSIAIRSGDDQRLLRGMKAKGLTFPVVNDNQGRLATEWGINATPTFIIIDKGKMMHSTSGWSSAWGLKLRLWWLQNPAVT